MEYQAAIGSASGDGRYGASHTLLRALIETTFRALWLIYIADEAAVESFVKGRIKPDLNDLIKWIRNRKKSYPQLAQFASACAKKAAVFHSYAHAGIEQLVRRRDGFDERERIALLNFADTFLVINGEIAAVVYDDPPLRRLTLAHAARLFDESLSLAVPDAPQSATPRPQIESFLLPPLPSHRGSPSAA